MSKGSKPRKLSVSREEFDRRWDRIFTKKANVRVIVEDPEPPKTRRIFLEELDRWPL